MTQLITELDEDACDKVQRYLDDGFEFYTHETLRPKARVRNRGEQYYEARHFGTATILAVLRKKGEWERIYRRKNIEVLVRRDRDGSLVWWADYGTELAHKQPN